jgi:membrane protein implicated in regulation of membrane protease activity
MTRVNAALLAGSVTVLLFSAAFAVVHWLTGAAGFWRVVESPLLLVGVIAFNCLALLPLVIWSRRRAKREEEEDERLMPLRPAERLKGRRGL